MFFINKFLLIIFYILYYIYYISYYRNNNIIYVKNYLKSNL